MKVLIPDTFTLVSSTVPINEAPIFINKIYSIGNKVTFNSGVYERLTNIDTFVPFDSKKIYQNGDTASFSSLNYICNNYIAFNDPSIDTSRWSSVSITAYAYSHLYSVGNVVSKDNRNYLCLTAHTSPATDTILPWVSGKASSYYTGGMCSYNGQYYQIKLAFTAGSWGSIIIPSTYIYSSWNIITATMILPTNSTYWADITDHAFLDTTLYTSGTVLNYLGNVYKCILDSAMPTPNTDTTRWMISASTLPTNTTDWKLIETTNRYKMFDQYFKTMTTYNGNIEVTLTDINFNAIYLGNIFADSVLIEVINNDTSLTIETKDIDLTVDCVDIFDYFFGDWMDYRNPTVKYERTSVFNNVSARITFRGDFVQVGIFVIGKSYFIGSEAWGVKIEALDFSTVTEDTETGEVYLQEGAELKVKSIDLWVDTTALKTIDNVLQRAKGKPAVYMSQNENVDTYGFIRKKEETLKMPTKSLISIDVRELL